MAVAMSEVNGDELVAAHRHCRGQRSELVASTVCGCFYCKETFVPSEIADWCDDGETALCPKCGVDSVLASESGWPVTDAAFLEAMHRFWFQNVTTR